MQVVIIQRKNCFVEVDRISMKNETNEMISNDMKHVDPMIPTT